jgi:hypothetical protein
VSGSAVGNGAKRESGGRPERAQQGRRNKCVCVRCESIMPNDWFHFAGEQMQARGDVRSPRSSGGRQACRLVTIVWLKRMLLPFWAAAAGRPSVQRIECAELIISSGESEPAKGSRAGRRNRLHSAGRQAGPAHHRRSAHTGQLFEWSAENGRAALPRATSPRSRSRDIHKGRLICVIRADGALERRSNSSPAKRRPATTRAVCRARRHGTWPPEFAADRHKWHI